MAPTTTLTSYKPVDQLLIPKGWMRPLRLRLHHRRPPLLMHRLPQPRLQRLRRKQSKPTACTPSASATSPKLGVGIEVPDKKAVTGNTLNAAVDRRHTFVYMKDDIGKYRCCPQLRSCCWMIRLQSLAIKRTSKTANWEVIRTGRHKNFTRCQELTSRLRNLTQASRLRIIFRRVLQTIPRLASAPALPLLLQGQRG